MKLQSFILLFILPFCLAAQDKKEFIDDKYFEDQFYVGIQYNSLANKASSLESTGTPYSFEVGFIKDIPLNKQRNKGLGLGIGYSYDVIRPNITISPNNNTLVYNINKDFSNYSYSSHNIEIPLEFRWRTSTPTNSSFWRFYTGASFVHKFKDKASFDTGINGNTFYKNNPDLRPNNYTVYTSVGFGTWNFHIKYYLKSPFKDHVKTSKGETLKFNQLKIGVMFYIL